MSDETALQPQIKFSWLIGTLAAFAIFAAIAGYSARMTNTYSDYDEGRAAVRKDTLAKVQKAENALLYPAVDAQGKAHAEWIDQAKGTVRIPIEDAMAQEVETLKGKQTGMGCEIVGAAPAAPAKPAMPAPSAAQTNAAPAPTAPATPAPALAKPKTEKEKK